MTTAELQTLILELTTADALSIYRAVEYFQKLDTWEGWAEFVDSYLERPDLDEIVYETEGESDDEGGASFFISSFEYADKTDDEEPDGDSFEYEAWQNRQDRLYDALQNIPLWGNYDSVWKRNEKPVLDPKLRLQLLKAIL